MLGFRGLRKASRVTLIQLDAPGGICRVDLAMVESSHGLPNIKYLSTIHLPMEPPKSPYPATMVDIEPPVLM